jgi:lactoylglutathione lyase
VENIALNLVVLRCADLDRAREFYSRLGLQFSRHQHGKGPEHWTGEVGGCVFELYPASSDSKSTLGTRIGFRIPNLDKTIAALSDFPGALSSPAKDTEWGRRAVILDPDGHKVELLESRG